MSEDGVRFGVGDPTSARSSTWKVWLGSPRNSVYIVPRRLGRDLKVSLHEPEPAPWRIAFTKEHAASERSLVPPGQDRLIRELVRPSETAPGVTRLFNVIVPESEITFPAYEGAEDPDVIWIAKPPAGTVVEFIFVRTTADVRVSSWPGRHSGTRLVGVLQAEDGSRVWVVVQSRPETEAERVHWETKREQLRHDAHVAARSSEGGASDIRALLYGPAGADGSWMFLDLLIEQLGRA